LRIGGSGLSLGTRSAACLTCQMQLAILSSMGTWDSAGGDELRR
jgi:hypothetical protein